MANRDQIEAFMKNFPSQERILSMEPEDLGTHMLKYMIAFRLVVFLRVIGRPRRLPALDST